MTLAHRRHPASLISFSSHNPYLIYLMSRPVDVDMVTYVARRMEKIFPLYPEFKPEITIISLDNFIVRLVRRANVQVSTLLTTLVYLERLRLKALPMRGRRDTPFRLFLALLIITSKYLNDASPKNVHWAQYAFFFSVDEVNFMEKQFLGLLNYDLRFGEAEACAIFAPFFFLDQNAYTRACTRALAVEKVTRASRARAQAQDIEGHLPPAPPTTPCPQPGSARRIVKRASYAQLVPGDDYSSGMRSTLSNASTSSSTSSSDIASLMDDTGSSPPSSRWNSDNSGSECSEDENGFSCLTDSMEEDADTTIIASQRVLSLSKAAIGKRPFKFRPVPPTCAYKNIQFTQRRTRKVSDTSSISTVMASPSIPSAPSSSSSSFLFPLRGSTTAQRLFHREPKRESSISDVSRKDQVAQGLTMPSIPRSTSVNVVPSTNGSFLSRMWGAATVGRAQSGLEQSVADQTHSVPRTLKRLVLVHSKSSVFSRANTGSASRAVEV